MSRLATPKEKGKAKADSHGEKPSPRAPGEQETPQSSELAEGSFHRTFVQVHNSGSGDALGSQGSRSVPTRETRQTRRRNLEKERSTPSGGNAINESSISGSERGKVAKGINTCLRILAEETSPLNHKRKSLGHILIPNRPEPQKKPPAQAQQKNKSPIQATLTPEGFFEVQVEQAYCHELGSKCGLSADEVRQSLEADNLERTVGCSSPPETTVTPPSDDEYTPGKFDPDSADELESDEE